MSGAAKKKGLRARARDVREAKPHTRRWLAVLRERRRTAAQNRRRLRRRFKRYLSALVNGAGSRAALASAGLDWATVNRWFGRSPLFRERIALARRWGELLRRLIREDEMHRRAVIGIREPVISGGVHVKGKDGKPLYRTRYSDRLLLKLVKADHPEKFANVSVVATTGPGDLAEVVRHVEGVKG